MAHLHFSTLADLARRLASGESSSVEIVQTFLERIARLDSTAGAYITVFAESALLQARAADIQRRSGVPLPPLHGLPVAVKDMLEIEGEITTAGSAAWRTRRSVGTSPVVEHLRGAGMVILGKVHMSEFAFSGWGMNTYMGTPRNAWSWDGAHRVPGGSSSGSAVAVAAGLVPAAIGSDTGGSIRIPASLNGITGLKPTSSLISRDHAVPLSRSFDSIGPMTRSVEDASLLLQAMGGSTPNGGPELRSERLIPTRPLKNFRIGVMRNDQYVWPVDAEVQQTADDALRVLRQLGANTAEVTIPAAFPEIFDDWHAITAAEAYHTHQAYIENDALHFDPWVKQRTLAGKTVTATRYIAALERRKHIKEQLLAWMRDYELIFSPTVPMTACTLAQAREDVTPLGTLTRWVNYFDGCAISLPAGFSSDGLPIGVQLVAKPGEEALLIEAGRAFQQETDWHMRVPDKLD